ncbi:MMPL family transporter [Streptomyces collinus]|uniref:MMPL family transporter n=1 Tax=Streptomyces collinus TaxID=42684 RepID=UPI002941F638|nr:MMPL family transporter [Streptomyces collinus]
MHTARRPVRWLVPVVLVIVWLGLGGAFGSYAGKLGEVSTNDQAAFLPRNAESTEVIDRQKAFDQRESLPAVVVWTADGGGGVTAAQQSAATRALRSLARSEGVESAPSPALRSRDGRALEGVVPLRVDLGKRLPDVLDDVRGAARQVGGTRVQIAGPAATQGDLADAFSGIDGILLGVALAAVLVILLAVYRSVVLPFTIIISSVFALGVASALVYVLADHDVVRVDGQVQGILSILVIGAATDYALLLTARFREELAHGGDKATAAWKALRGSLGAITASAATVALGLLALLVSDLTNNRALGPVGAIGIVCALVTTLTFLPAVLALLGRAAFWPARPRSTDAETGGHGIWRRVAHLVDTRPRRLWPATLALLVAAAAFSPLLQSKGVPLDELFINDAPSVAAQQTLGKHFPGGSGQPVVIIADADRLDRVTRTAAATTGVAGAQAVSASGRPGGAPLVVDGRVRVDATLADAPDSDAAKRTVQRLRDRLPGADPHALVGGYTAQRYDTQRTAEHDRAVIIPVVLAIILFILVVLLRSLLLPVLLVATVALNYLATLGIAGLVFRHVFGFSGTDASVPLYGFVFLVALGVDYNIFLMSRVREETIRVGARQGMLRGLVTTGGVITSAGVVLAATFAALIVIPLAFLAQIAFIVAFGVLLDTIVVRSLLVPALARDIGPAIWWPSRLARARAEARPQRPVAVAEEDAAGAPPNA